MTIPLLRNVILLTVSCALFVPSPVLAQEEDDEATKKPIEEIVVTARKVEEARQDVPATISVLTASQLESAGVQRPEDYVKLVAGVSIVNAAEVGDTQVNIRGINGARDAENSFAFIVDGILMTNPAAFNREYANLQQIEVLKGPQGAIYGRNAAAGAIILTTRPPGDTQEGEFRLSLGEDNTYLGSLTFGGPLGNGNTKYQIHGDWRSSDGYYTNVFQNDDVADDFNSFNIDGRLILEPDDRTTWDLKARYGEVDAASITFNAAFALPTFASVLQTPEFFEDVNQHEFVFQGNIDPQNDQSALELSVRLNRDYDWGNLTAWLLYSDIENSLSADGTSGAFGFFNAEENCMASTAALFNAGVTLPAPQFLGPDPANSLFGPYTPTTCDGTQYQVRNQDDLSLEVRFSGDASDRLRWQTGIYYLTLDRAVGVNLGIDQGQGVVRQLFVPQGGANPTEQLLHDQFGTEVFAVFGQLLYDLNDKVELSFALRYDSEDRDVTNLVPPDARTQYVDFTLDGEFLGGAPLNPGLDPNLNPGGTIEPRSETFDEFQPKISGTWDVSDNTTLFGSWGVGFKSGGFNNQGSSATVELFFNTLIGTDLVIDDQFEKETSSAFEVGFKSDVTDEVYFEGAVYSVEVDDMQFFEFLVGPFGLLRVVSNIDEVSIKGAEIGLGWAASDNVNVYGGFNVTDSEIKKNTSRPATVGNKSPYTPDYTGSLGVDFRVPLSSDWDFFASGYLTLVGKTWFHTVQNNTRTTLFDALFPGLGTGDYVLTERDSYETLDLRVGVSRRLWSALLWATNVTDEQFLEENITAPEFGGSFIHPGTRRRIGVEVTFRF